MRWKFAVLLSATLAVACDGYSTGPEDGEASLTGLFHGTIEGLETDRDNPFSHTVNLSLTEYGHRNDDLVHLPSDRPVRGDLRRHSDFRRRPTDGHVFGLGL